MSFDCDFFNYASSVGINFKDNIALRTGELIRCDVEGSRNGSKTGWYVWHDDLKPFAVFGDWKSYGDETFYWSAQDISEITAKEQREMRRKAKEAAKKNAKIKKQAQDDAAKDCYKKIGKNYAVYHPYASMKGFDLLKLSVGELITQKNNNEIVHKDLLMIPMQNAYGDVRNIQYIKPDGFKMFHPMAQVKGCFHMVRNKGSKDVIVCEGFATGKALQMVVNCDICVAFNTSNLVEVCSIMMTSYESVNIAADDDWQVKEPIDNPGLTKAKEAAKITGGLVIKPPFDNTLRNKKDTDWDDFLRINGNLSAKEIFKGFNL